MNQLKIIRGSEVNARDNVFEIGRCHYRFLAHGDSWFSIGSVPLAPVGNLLTEMRFSKGAIAVNCARPGNTLARMADYRREKWFERTLLQRNGWDWHALLLSCGGNDLIDVCQVLAYGIPEADYLAVGHELIHRFNMLGNECAADTQRFPNLHFLDTMAIPLVPAALRDPDDSGDWINEIHLNRRGLKKFAPCYVALVEEVLRAQGLPG